MEPHDFELGSQKVGEEGVRRRRGRRRRRRRRMDILLREKEENKEGEGEEGEVVDEDPAESWERTNS